MGKLRKLSTNQLFAAALSVPLWEFQSKFDWNEEYKPHKRGIFKIYPWDALDELEKRATPKIYRKARKLCRSKNPNKRVVGVYLLAYFDGRDSKLHRKARLRILLKMFDKEEDTVVLRTLSSSLGHFEDARVNWQLYLLSDYEDEVVRNAVAMNVHLFDLELDYMIGTLIKLSEDESAFVRDWATFRLHHIEFDRGAIHEALAARLTDPDDETRSEAVMGLAKRKDPRAVVPLINELERKPDEHNVLEAAEALADPCLLPTLRAIQADWIWRGVKKNDYSFEELRNAIRACEAGA